MGRNVVRVDNSATILIPSSHMRQTNEMNIIPCLRAEDVIY